jgi:hypothetical protein
MTVMSMASFKEAKDKEKKGWVSLWKRQNRRYLGGRVHVAQWDYSCDNCIMTIRPGDQYRRDKYVNAFGFRTKRTHWPECYGPTEEEDREMRDQIERGREAEKEAERCAA